MHLTRGSICALSRRRSVSAFGRLSDLRVQLTQYMWPIQVALLYALGSIAAELEDPDDAFLRMCQRAVERIVGVYILLWPKQRPPAHEALRCLFGALEGKPQALQAVLSHFVEVALTCTLAPPNPDVAAGD